MRPTLIAVVKDDVLARVDGDLTRGHTYPALQRLATLTAAHPDDLGLRARRAAVNRLVGNVVEAGRWGFLTEDVAAAELAAFERAWPKAWSRLRALRLQTDPAAAVGKQARQRLASLIEAASNSVPSAWRPLADLPDRPSVQGPTTGLH